MAEQRITQLLISERSFDRAYMQVKDRIDRMLSDNLRRDGCHTIVVLKPHWTEWEEYVDEEGNTIPEFHGYEIIAEGERDA